MPGINPQEIGVKQVKGAYDLCLAYFTENPDLLPVDTTAHDQTLALMEMTLREANYQRTPQVPTLIENHNSKLDREGGARTIADTADKVSIALFEAITGTKIASRSAAAAPAQPVLSSPTPAAARAAGHSISADMALMIDPFLASATNNAVSGIEALLTAANRIEEKLGEIETVRIAYEDAIGKYKAGETDVDESGIRPVEKHPASGFAKVKVTPSMAPAINKLLAENVTPPITIEDLLETIRNGEDAIAAGMSDFRALDRALRQAKPKRRTKAASPSQASDDAAALNEIEAIDADCDVIEELASDIFSQRVFGNAAASEILKFPVPKLDFGIPHPDVPEIDPTFRFNVKTLVEAMHAIASNEIIWIYGDSGCGKSEFCRQVAAHLNMPFTRMNLDGHLSRSDIVGVNRLLPDEKGNPTMRFIEGILPRAMRRPGLLLLDEFDLGDPEIMPIFQPVLEGNPLLLLEDGGRVVRPHPQFRIILTGNTTGLGSDDMMYVNVFEQSAATRDRISAFVEMQYMPASEEKKVVMARFPDADPTVVDKLIQLANKVRDGYRQKELQTLFSTRAVQYCIKRHTRLAPLYSDPSEAIHDILTTVVINRLDNTSALVVNNMVESIFA